MKKWPILLAAVLATWPLMDVPSPAQQVDQKVRRAPDFGAGDVWLDQGSPVPHHIADYRGHVVLVDFWEYTCINCIRDFGVIKRWYVKYHPYGFDVIGVHYGEFNIGFDANHVRDAAQRYRLPWAVVADQEGTAWKAYAAQGWPDRFLIDQDGKIVMGLFGERNNRTMEQKLRELLTASHPEVMKVELDPDEDEFRPECGTPTQETFAGLLYGRGSVENLGDHKIGDVAEFVPPHSPPDGGVMLVGRWRVERDGITSDSRGAAAEVRYHARTLYAVLSPPPGKPVRVNLFQDGAPLAKEAAGTDVKFDAKGAYIDVVDARMYYLLRSPVFNEYLVSLQADGPGLTLHSFTYGNDCQLVDNP